MNLRIVFFLFYFLWGKVNHSKSSNFNGPHGKYSIGSINLDMLYAYFFDEETLTENSGNINLDEDMDVEWIQIKKLLI